MTTTDTGAARTGPALAAMASIGAGVIHASAVGVHGEHGQAALAFALLAVFQVGWGALVFARPGRWLYRAGVAGNGAAVAGWLLTRTTGIGFVDGLEAAEGPGLPDTLAALLGGVAVAGALAALVAPDRLPRLSGTAQAPVAAATALLVVVAMVATGGHAHADGHGHDELATGAHAHGDGEDHGDDDHDHAPGESAAGAAGHGGDHDHGGADAGTGADGHDDDHDHAAGTRRTGPGSTHDDHDHPPGTDGDHDDTRPAPAATTSTPRAPVATTSIRRAPTRRRCRPGPTTARSRSTSAACRGCRPSSRRGPRAW